MIEKCPNCGGLHYRTDPCRPKSKPESREADPAMGEAVAGQATAALTPKPKRDRNEYMANYMRTVYRPKRKMANAVVNNG